jgi:transcriptional regulator with XRE-family HTH domain
MSTTIYLQKSTIIDMETIGDRLRALREERQLTLEQAGAIADTSKQSMSQIEKGVTREPGGLALYRWAEYYGVDLKWLITGKGPRRGQGSQPARLDPEMLAESIEALRRVWARRDLVFDPIAQPEMVAYAYELLAEMGDEPTTAQLIDFGAKLAERDKAKAGAENERNEDKRSSGVDRARAKGRGSKPA